MTITVEKLMEVLSKAPSNLPVLVCQKETDESDAMWFSIDDIDTSNTEPILLYISTNPVMS